MGLVSGKHKTQKPQLRAKQQPLCPNCSQPSQPLYLWEMPRREHLIPPAAPEAAPGSSWLPLPGEWKTQVFCTGISCNTCQETHRARSGAKWERGLTYTELKTVSEWERKPARVCAYSWILKSLLGIWEIRDRTCLLHKRCFEMATAFLFT